MDIRSKAEQYNDYIIEKRRYFHENPEPSFEEVNTTAYLKKEFEDMGMEVQTFEPEYLGLVATLKGGRPGKTVMLRSDIDALRVTEATGLPFASKNDGVMHACGHDAHMAMLLGAARILSDMRDELPGTVKFILQSAEEMAYGAKWYVDNGILDGVDAIFGMHIWGTVRAPLINAVPGPRMASCDNFKITINGVTAHGSAPHLGKDAIVAAGAVLMNLQIFASRINNTLNPFVLSIGMIHGGTTYNSICNLVEMEGTIRTFDPELRKTLKGTLEQIIFNTVEAHGCTAELEFRPLLPAVINTHEDLNRIARDAAVKLYGEEGLSEMDPLMGSEDYALFMEAVPGFFGFIGAINPDKDITYTNHHEKFTVDEDSLQRGSAWAAQFAVDYLNEKQ